jgi:hypothetical protein
MTIFICFDRDISQNLSLRQIFLIRVFGILYGHRQTKVYNIDGTLVDKNEITH